MMVCVVCFVINPLRIVGVSWTGRLKWTESSRMCIGRDVLRITSLQEVPVFVARICMDGVFSVCGCLFFYFNLQSSF